MGGLSLSAIGLAALAAATPVASAPLRAVNFEAMEQAFAATGEIAAADARLGDALIDAPDLASQIAWLRAAGAHCREFRSGETRCLVHEYSLSDGAADDIRWLISLHETPQGVTQRGLSRLVDRHGT